ncbi:MAG: DUF2892 domain-containing protein [Thiopseudomonas sp.]|nr:DUF2892 domain-containing protein [Thiopseudomonas sp.]
MKVNMATWDRAARVVVGLVLIALTLTGVIGLWGWIGVVPVVTGGLGMCPAYSIFGFSTCKKCCAKP